MIFSSLISPHYRCPNSNSRDVPPSPIDPSRQIVASPNPNGCSSSRACFTTTVLKSCGTIWGSTSRPSRSGRNVGATSTRNEGTTTQARSKGPEATEKRPGLEDKRLEKTFCRSSEEQGVPSDLYIIDTNTIDLIYVHMNCSRIEVGDLPARRLIKSMFAKSFGRENKEHET